MGRGEYTERLEVLNFFFHLRPFSNKEGGGSQFRIFPLPPWAGGGSIGSGNKKDCKFLNVLKPRR